MVAKFRPVKAICVRELSRVKMRSPTEIGVFGVASIQSLFVAFASRLRFNPTWPSIFSIRAAEGISFALAVRSYFFQRNTPAPAATAQSKIITVACGQNFIRFIKSFLLYVQLRQTSITKFHSTSIPVRRQSIIRFEVIQES